MIDDSVNSSPTAPQSEQVARPRVVIVTPARASANNGNWQTTARWSRFLADQYEVQIVDTWRGEPADLLIGLHARRSASSIAQFAETGKPLIVVLTGTDLYRDIRSDDNARHSLQVASRLVVLQAAGLDELSADLKLRTVVIEQSAPTLPRLASPADTFELILVGHMRAEKDPLTALRAVHGLDDPQLRLRHIGRCDDPDIGPAAQALARADNRIELLGPMAHEKTRAEIRRADVLLLPSVMEGGANVLIEAVTSGVPVLASEIPGSIGMMGADYPGFFPVGNAAALGAQIARCRNDAQWLASLTRHGQARAHLFAPQREAKLVNELVAQLLAG